MDDEKNFTLSLSQMNVKFENKNVVRFIGPVCRKALSREMFLSFNYVEKALRPYII